MMDDDWWLTAIMDGWLFRASRYHLVMLLSYAQERQKRAYRAIREFSNKQGTKVLPQLVDYLCIDQIIMHEQHWIEQTNADLVTLASLGRSTDVSFLLDGFIDVRLCDRRSKRVPANDALAVAAEKGHTAVVEALLSAGADPSARNVDSVPPLVLAARQGHVRVVQLLLAASADIRSRAQGLDAAQWASRNGHERARQCLAQAGERERVEIHARINAAEATLTKHIESLGGVPEELKEAFALVTPALTQKLKILREAFQRSSVRMFQGTGAAAPVMLPSVDIDKNHLSPLPRQRPSGVLPTSLSLLALRPRSSGRQLQ
jgi:hypothetical protein